MSWHKPLIPALGAETDLQDEFRASLAYVVPSTEADWLFTTFLLSVRATHSQKKKKKTKRELSSVYLMSLLKLDCCVLGDSL